MMSMTLFFISIRFLQYFLVTVQEVPNLVRILLVLSFPHISLGFRFCNNDHKKTSKH